MNSSSTRILLTALLFCLAARNATAADRAPGLVLGNKQVQRFLEKSGDTWRTTGFARADGGSPLKVNSDEFGIVLMDGTELTVADYRVIGEPHPSTFKGGRRVSVEYEPARKLPDSAPTFISIEYVLRDDEPYLRKRLKLSMNPDQAIDRLEVERFSTDTRATRGGRGEPVFVGDAWFFGLEYPAAQTRHSDDYTPRPYEKIGNFSYIDLEGHDKQTHPRAGLITLAQFPGNVHQKVAEGKWIVYSKWAVAGVGQPGDPLELAFRDYWQTIKRPARSFVHYNNWYDHSGKNLHNANFVDKIARPFVQELGKYGVKVDAFVPDNGWQNRGSIWEPRGDVFPHGVGDLARALNKEGTGLGFWIAINGYETSVGWGKQHGYPEAVRNRHFSQFEPYYCIVTPQYKQQIRASLKNLIEQGKLTYFKHDFNEMCCKGEDHGHVATDRHGHEASVDEMIDLLGYERDLKPDIFQNVTNWTWFSPWWLMHCDSIWMLGGDSELSRAWPQRATRAMATSYRDTHLHSIWGDPETRPLVPISSLMTHGIIWANGNLEGDRNETLRDWADYVMMYFGRGVQLKELYITPSMMTPDRWKVLGEATKWATVNASILQNAVYVGGDPAKGQTYGYVSWNKDRGILVARNPTLTEATLSVPFDKTVWYRGATGKTFHGRVIYPYLGALGQQFTSGKPMEIKIPGESVLVCELLEGKDDIIAQATPAPPVVKPLAAAESEAACEVTLPGEAMKRCDLYLVARGPLPVVTVNTTEVKAAQANQGSGWRLASYDLSAFRGQKVTIYLASEKGGDSLFSSNTSDVSAWLVMDRGVPERAAENADMPWAIDQGFRRQTVELFANKAIDGPSQATPRALTLEQLRTARAAKLRVEVFGSDGGAKYGDKQIVLNGKPIGRVPVNDHGDQWQPFVLDLERAAIESLQVSNQVELTNAGGDSYKFKGLTLAVELPDGKWVRSGRQQEPQTSAEDWAHREGPAFKNDRSAPVVLKFE